MECIIEISQKSKNITPYNPATILFGIYLSPSTKYLFKRLYVHLLTFTIVLSARTRILKYPKYIHNTVYCSVDGSSRDCDKNNSEEKGQITDDFTYLLNIE